MLDSKPTAKYKIGFWGSPAISASLMQQLHSSEIFSVEFALTQPDKARSKRGRQVLPSAVKKAALELGIDVLTPSSLKKNNQELIENIKAYQCDLFVILAYGKIIPETLYSLPKFQSLNFHASLLPKLRGAAPIEYALIQGDHVTGWTLQKINDSLDAGDVCFQTKVTIDWAETKDSLYQKLTATLLETSEEALLNYLAKNILQPQQDSDATFCGKFSTNDGKIDWQQSAFTIRNRARAFSAKPGVFSCFRGRKIKLQLDFAMSEENIISKSQTDKPINQGPKQGQIIEISEEVAYVQCKDYSLPIISMQPEGKKAMSVTDFVNGYQCKVGSLFTSEP